MPQPALCPSHAPRSWSLGPSHAPRSRSLSVTKTRFTKELRNNMTVDNVPLSEEMRIKKQEGLAKIEELLKMPVKERVSRGLAEG